MRPHRPVVPRQAAWRLHYSRRATGDPIRDHIDAGSPLGKEMKGVLSVIDVRQPVEKVTEDIFDAIHNPPRQTTG